MSMRRVGLIGLGVMGRNLALNWRDHEFGVFGFDSVAAARQRFVSEAAGQVFADVRELIAALPRPRVLCLMIPAGASVMLQVRQLLPLLSSGDILIDAGNSYYRDTETLQVEAAEASVQLIGMGISGGRKGARHGPSIMAGGDAAVLAAIAPLFTAIAARTPDGNPCFTTVGPGGSGHFVKMIHNGIEYADMQLIAEAIYLLRYLGGLRPADVARVFREWNRGELASYLMEVSAEVLDAVDPQDGEPLVDKIVDCAAQNGTGHWAAVAAFELGVPAPCIAEAVFARSLSTLQDEREQQKLTPPAPLRLERGELLPALEAALLGGKIAAYAQGFAVIEAANRKYGWNADLAALARGWTGGCIIRARLLQDIAASFAMQPRLSNLLLAPTIAARLDASAAGWRRALGWAISNAMPVPVMAAGLSWRDAFAAGRLWADVIQGQRDCFGAHGFERIDRPGKHHHEWGRG